MNIMIKYGAALAPRHGFLPDGQGVKMTVNDGHFDIQIASLAGARTLRGRTQQVTAR